MHRTLITLLCLAPTVSFAGPYTGAFSTLGPNVNTADDEHQMSVSTDGNTLFWRKSISGAQPQIFQATGTEGSWSDPATLMPSQMQPIAGCDLHHPIESPVASVVWTTGGTYNCSKAGWGGSVRGVLQRWTDTASPTATVIARTNFDTGYYRASSFDDLQLMYSRFGNTYVATRPNTSTPWFSTEDQLNTAGGVSQYQASGYDHGVTTLDGLTMYATDRTTFPEHEVYQLTRPDTTTAWNDPSVIETLLFTHPNMHDSVYPLTDGRLVISVYTGTWANQDGDFDLYVSDGVMPVPDTDGDGMIDEEDNCPGVNSLDVTDSDGDGYGDLCAHPSANIDSTVTHLGAYIGPKATIMANAEIGLGAVVGRRAHVGEGAKVGAGTVLARATTVENGAGVGASSALGYGASVNEGNVGSGLIMANLVQLRAETVGDNVRIGRASEIVSTRFEVDGVTPKLPVIGNGVHLGPGTVVDSTVIEGDVRVRRDVELYAGTVESAASLGRNVVLCDETRVKVGAVVRAGNTLSVDVEASETVPRATRTAGCPL